MGKRIDDFLDKHGKWITLVSIGVVIGMMMMMICIGITKTGGGILPRFKALEIGYARLNRDKATKEELVKYVTREEAESRRGLVTCGD